MLTKEIMYKCKVMIELGFDQSDKHGMIIFCDNQSVQFIAENWLMGSRSVHMNSKYHMVRQEFIQKRLFFIHVEGTMNIIDCLTKPSDIYKFRFDRDKMMFGNDATSVLNDMDIYMKRIQRKASNKIRKQVEELDN
jgi:hypothetical protein